MGMYAVTYWGNQTTGSDVMFSASNWISFIFLTVLWGK